MAIAREVALRLSIGAAALGVLGSFGCNLAPPSTGEGEGEGEESGPITINEVDCNGRDHIEIAAPAGTDLTGFVVTDDAASTDPSHRFVLPAGSVVTDSQLFVVDQVKGAEAGFAFGISCAKDELALFNAAGAVVSRVAMPDTGVALEATYGRVPDRTGAFALTEQTLGTPNVAFLDGSVDLFDPAHIVNIDLTIDDAAKAALDADPGTFVAARFVVTSDGDPIADLQTGLRLKGGRAGSFRDLTGKASFKLKLNEVVKGQRFLGLERLNLNNMVEDPSLMHETVGYHILAAAGVPASRTTYANVTLNGAPYGLYVLIESYDDTFAAKSFASTQHIYEGAFNVDTTAGSEGDFEPDVGDEVDRADLTALIAATTAPDATFFAALSEQLDVDAFLTAMAADVAIGHFDGYATGKNNYFLHSASNGDFTLISAGLDQCLDPGTFEGALLDLHTGLSPFASSQAVIMQRCMVDGACRAAYDDKLRALAPAFAGVDAFIADVAAAIRPSIEADLRRPPSPIADVDAAQAATRDYVSRRRAELSAL